jgi:DNA topoisomerase-3
LTVNESVEMAQKEIKEVFSLKESSPETDTFNGFYGDLVGPCPLCGKDVIKGRYGYGCSGYKEGCNFRISGVICKRVIPISKAKLLVSTGDSGLIKGFISKAGKSFDARLVLEDGKAVFKF